MGDNSFFKNLGQVSALVESTAEPVNKAIIWKDTSQSPAVLKVYNSSTNTWVDLYTGSVAGSYMSAYDPTFATPEDFGGIPAGTLVSSLNGNAFSKMWDEALFKTVFASITTNRAITLGSMLNGNIERLTPYSLTILATYNHGEITDGDGVTTSEIGGASSKYVYTDFDGNIVTHNVADADNDNLAISGKVTLGSHRCEVALTHAAGVKSYLDSKGNVYTDAAIDIEIAKTSDQSYSAYITGKDRALVGTFATDGGTADYVTGGRLDKSKLTVSELGAALNYTRTLDFNGKKKFVIAYPNTLRDITTLSYIAAVTGDILPDAVESTEDYEMPDGSVVVYKVFVFTQSLPGTSGHYIKAII